MKTRIALIVLAAGLTGSEPALAQAGALPEWPAISAETKPWSRWWWPGSIVTEKDLTSEMESYAKAGLGGLELTPIYGVAGYENQFNPYLSPQWVDKLVFAVAEAKRLGLGLDMATGTGWPFGGPMVGIEDACKYVAFKTWTVPGGGTLSEPVAFQQETILRVVGNQIYEIHDILKPEGEDPQGTMQNPLLRRDTRTVQIGELIEPVADNKNLQALALDQVRWPKPIPLQTLMAYGDNGQVLDLTEKVGPDGKLDWTAPPGQWTLYGVFQGWHGKMVERAAPGGEGNVIDHFSSSAIKNYLAHFDRAFANRDLSGLRGYFNDSYEVDDSTGQSDWTPLFFAEFQKRRGYDLRTQLPALLGRDTPDKNARVLTDYRETLSDLLLHTFTVEWTNWAHARGALVRNQAHGAPANILDLYAATDIPETEGADIFRIKWATSAAHVSGRKLISAEAATWLRDHFEATLADVRQNVDRYFLGGVNHVVYHGTCYSPPGDPWPGFLFYASVEFNSRNPFWTDFGAFNQYVARVQSFLQRGQPANDVLLYFPASDVFAAPPAAPGRPPHLGGGGRQGSESFAETANALQTRGYAFDYISDRLLQKVYVAPGGTLQTGGTNYKVVVVPACEYLPAGTLAQFARLAQNGATVVFSPSLPKSYAGYDPDGKNAQAFQSLHAAAQFAGAATAGVSEAKIGAGRYLLGENIEQLLALAGVKRETMVDQGLQYARRHANDGTTYFIANWGEQPVNAWVPLATQAGGAAIFDPMTGRRGYANPARVNPQTHEISVYLQLRPSETCIVQTQSRASASDASYAYYQPAGAAQTLSGGWTLDFTEGGPQLPASVKLDELASWTAQDGEAYKIFSGTAKYTAIFAGPPQPAAAYQLNLGVVRETARVRLNGQDLGTLIGPEFVLTFPGSLLHGQCTLEVFVSNTMANRIIDLDKRGVPWKKFYNVNMPAQRAENRNAQGLFDARNWAPFPSGLLGPVTLTPLQTLAP